MTERCLVFCRNHSCFHLIVEQNTFLLKEKLRKWRFVEIDEKYITIMEYFKISELNDTSSFRTYKIKNLLTEQEQKMKEELEKSLIIEVI
jgi:hypothetical protein